MLIVYSFLIVCLLGVWLLEYLKHPRRKFDDWNSFTNTILTELDSKVQRHHILQAIDEHKRSGITLIELLVVISIITIVATFTLPRLSLWANNRSLRESARALRVYIEQCRNLAETDIKPFAVVLSRESINVCKQLKIIKLNTYIYGGDTNSSYAQFRFDTTYNISLKCEVDGGWSSNFVKRGDLLKINYQGILYKIVDDPSDNMVGPDRDYPVVNGYIDLTVPNRWLSLEPETLTPSVSPFGEVWSLPLPIQIWLQPSFIDNFGISQTPIPPLRLFRQCVIDLEHSGVGDTTNFSSSTNIPLIISFNKSGQVDHIYIDGEKQRIIKPVYLLIRIRQPEMIPWKDSRNFWISITPAGKVWVGPPKANATTIDESRELARQAQAVPI